MKHLLIIMLMFTFVISNAQEQPQSNQQQIEVAEVPMYLTDTNAEHVYKVLIKQQFIIGISYLFSWIIVFLFIIIAYKVYIYGNSAYSLYDNGAIQKSMYEKYEALVIFTIILVIFIISITVVNIIYIPDMMSAIFNPEYGALQDILKMIK